MSIIPTLIIGNNDDAPYHKLQAVQQLIIDNLGASFQVTSVEGTTHLKVDVLRPYPLVVSYLDMWGKVPEAEETACLLQYVAGGGGLLVIHNGISIQGSPELSQLIGARFTGHPAFTTLPFEKMECDHPLLNGLESFEMDEEPYRFELDPFAPIELLLTYTHEGKQWPAAWTRAYGLGRVVYLMPGHHPPSFQSETYGKWIRSAGYWAAGVPVT
ncbi:ThuA domain-containing protein [Paenibacillus qinlingensis]|uniref:Type 1 glutamine amidotransferase n=1 Tax=Paenibacillus qinlingensis TaxID=1837343 RepID=A0ABU1P1V0_9BACL|nr:ThuA domain-containing protein [Paenibacillus qinlingensis]MDR6553728.1 type 1 glutamine amidotransferase [Paenibacillus qinlingensis]